MVCYSIVINAIVGRIYKGDATIVVVYCVSRDYVVRRILKSDSSFIVCDSVIQDTSIVGRLVEVDAPVLVVCYDII